MLKQAAGVSVTYTCEAGTFTVTAIPGQTRYDVINDQGVSARVHGRDFLIDVADLVLAGVPIIPQPGHTMTHGGQTFEVLPDASGHCFAIDPQRVRYRIHTKEVAEG